MQIFADALSGLGLAPPEGYIRGFLIWAIALGELGRAELPGQDILKLDRDTCKQSGRRALANQLHWSIFQVGGQCRMFYTFVVAGRIGPCLCPCMVASLSSRGRPTSCCS